MKFGEYLEKNQPLVYRTFANAAATKRVSHAYLLSGGSRRSFKRDGPFLGPIPFVRQT